MAETFTGAEYVHYLWHLHKAGIITITPPPVPNNTEIAPIAEDGIDTSIWERQHADAPAGSTVKIALIDNGANRAHPNLPDQECLIDALDLASHPFGATYEAPTGEVPDDGSFKEEEVGHFQGASVVLTELNLPGGLQDQPKPVTKLLADLGPGENPMGVRRRLKSYDQEFPRHGTLTAGVIGARAPAADDTDGFNYFGADPLCQIIPINTPFSPGFRELCLALIYARLKGADVICMPRGATPLDAMQPSPDEDENDGDAIDEDDDDDDDDDDEGSDEATTPTQGVEQQAPSESRVDRMARKRRINDPRLTRLSRRDDLFRPLFEYLLRELSKKIPILLAAGNDGRAHLAYPASLATPVAPEPGSPSEPANGLIAVGAVNGGDHRASYSSGQRDLRLTVYAPSDDEEQMHSDDQRADPLGDRSSDHNLDAVPGPLSDVYVGWTVLSTDVPGAFGGNAEEVVAFGNPGRPTEGSLYASFGGTSAAVAIAAGVVSLAIREYRIAQSAPTLAPDPIVLKQQLYNTARQTDDCLRIVNATALLSNITSPPQPGPS